MPIDLIVSPPASGKTNYCLNQLFTACKDNPHKDVWFLVPDGYQATAIRQRIAEQGGALGVHVATYGSLFREILEASGNSVPLAPSALVHKLIRQAIAETYEKNHLYHYGAIREKPGFVNALQTRFAELKRSLVYPEDFTAFAVDQSKPLQELAEVYASYQEKLKTLGWEDPEGLSWLAVEFLKTNPDWLPNWPLLILDGFDSFTKPQLETLGFLSEIVGKIIITLPGDKEMYRPVHRRFLETQKALQAITEITKVEGDFEDRLVKPLLYLEKNLGISGAEPVSGANNIAMLEARSPVEEVRESLRWLKGLILRENVDLRKCAITIPDQARYIPHIKSVADEFGLPIHISVGRYLSDTPLFIALLGMLQLSAQDYPRRLLLDTLRSPYFNLQKYSLSHQDAGDLDILSHNQQIVGGSKVWLGSLAALETKEEKYQIDSESQAPQLPIGARASELRNGLRAFFNRLNLGDNNQTIKEWIAWLEDLMEETEFIQAYSLESDRAALDSLRQILRELVLAEMIAGDEEVEYRTFLELLMDHAGGVEVKDTSWPSKPSILVLRTIEGRGMRHQAVAFLGLSEGIFPRTQKADPFLDEGTRQALGLESAFDQFQLGLFYQAITRTNQHLLLTRPYLANDGETWEASPYWEAVNDLLLEEPEKINPEANRDIADACSPQEALAWAMQARKIPESVKQDLLEQTERVLHGRDVLENRIEHKKGGIYNGDLSKIVERIREVYGQNAKWSASRLESYIACPYMFLASNLLGLESIGEPSLGLDPAQLGSILHRILERVYQEVDDPTNLSQLIGRIDKVAFEEFAEAPEREGFRPTLLWEQEQIELKVRIAKTIEALHEKSRGWKPVGYEAAFGLRGNPPLELEIGDQVIQLRGFIDRVDQDELGNLRIIDYKTGSSKLGVKDLEKGIRLQLPLYALAARDALGMGNVNDGFYWAINAADWSSLRLGKYGFEDAVNIALTHVEKVVEGVSQTSFLPKSPPGGCPDYCPAAAWCWEYIPVRRWA
jgi:ATP-dependent helicase/nuclease subunit B